MTKHIAYTQSIEDIIGDLDAALIAMAAGLLVRSLSFMYTSFFVMLTSSLLG